MSAAETLLSSNAGEEACGSNSGLTLHCTAKGRPVTLVIQSTGATLTTQASSASLAGPDQIRQRRAVQALLVWQARASGPTLAPRALRLVLRRRPRRAAARDASRPALRAPRRCPPR